MEKRFRTAIAAIPQWYKHLLYLDHKRPRIHAALARAESTQIRTEKNRIRSIPSQEAGPRHYLLRPVNADGTRQNGEARHPVLQTDRNERKPGVFDLICGGDAATGTI